MYGGQAGFVPSSVESPSAKLQAAAEVVQGVPGREWPGTERLRARARNGKARLPRDVFGLLEGSLKVMDSSWGSPTPPKQGPVV